MASSTHEAALRAFLALPVSGVTPSGVCCSDVYISTRRLELDLPPGQPPAVLALAINPASRFVWLSHPIKHADPTAASAYPDLMRALYRAFTHPSQSYGDARFRPSKLLTNDPMLAAMLERDLGHGSGTAVAAVVETEAVFAEASVGASANQRHSLLSVADGLFTGFQTALCNRDGPVPLAASFMHDAKVRPSKRREGKFASCVKAPVRLMACCDTACGKLGSALLKCSRCKQAFYCSRECQRRAWPRHKTFCVDCAPPDGVYL